ncbi:MAG: PDGLE domain-containing protein [Promethearchaeota archaeon]
MKSKTKLTIGVITILTIFLLLAPFADPNPDGLESAADDYASEGNVFDLGILSDYGSKNSLLFQLIGNEQLSIIFSGLIGILFVMGVLLIPIAIVRHKKSTETSN